MKKNIVQLTIEARKVTGKFIGVPVKNGEFAVAEYIRTNGKSTADKVLLTEWQSMDACMDYLEKMGAQ